MVYRGFTVLLYFINLHKLNEMLYKPVQTRLVWNLLLNITEIAPTLIGCWPLSYDVLYNSYLFSVFFINFNDNLFAINYLDVWLSDKRLYVLEVFTVVW